jgi:membrane-bound lytic murein transglycosylase B
MMPARSMRWAIAGIAMGLTLAACESTNTAGGHKPQTPPGSPAPPVSSDASTGGAFAFASSGDSGFDAWRVQFAAKADGTGRNDAVIKSVLEGLVPVEQTVQTQSFDNQAEFVKPIWDYAKTAVSPTRIANGQDRSWRPTSDDLRCSSRQSYAPPREIVAAIWGMESSYGGVHRHG